VKISVLRIITDHLSTLRNSVSNKISATDIIIFFLLPVIVGITGFFSSIKVSKDFCNISVTFFGIFVALLLNFQVAAFGIYNRKWGIKGDEKLSLTQTKEIEVRRLLLREINSNISYLILISIGSILLFIFLYTTDTTGRIAAAISWGIYIHFILTLLMVVKRSHIIFRREYDET